MSRDSMRKIHLANKASENDLGTQAAKRDLGRAIVGGAKKAAKTIINPIASLHKGMSLKPKTYRNERERTNDEYENMYAKSKKANEKSTIDKLKELTPSMSSAQTIRKKSGVDIIQLPKSQKAIQRKHMLQNRANSNN